MLDLWVIWTIAGCALAAGEIATTGFFLAPFALGAFLAAAVDAAGAPDALSVAVFLIASTLVFATLRPVARRHTRMPPAMRTGTAALVGARALVLEPVDQDHGAVKLHGEIWTARRYDEDAGTIAAGERVHVIEIRGATALVTEE